ncbi:protein-disulfide reductase DsbD family protein [Cellvibrio mixtus]|uniref:protein-disulfide reductase DsbD family protein n=1 Tax=Cellvibrio mixtus TaxID=39650 RepID=UPI000A4441A0|nr:thioredoxin family protein [Cellvibrio mixtus]
MLSGVGKYLRVFRGMAFVWLLSGAAVAHSQQGAQADRAATPQVEAQLVASVNAVVPGSEIYLGVNQKIIPHWHTYWINPGDSGNATTISWTLPEGASASDIIWPAPGRFSMGPITNYAYENSVTLLSKISVPSSIAVGDTFTARALVDWLVCAEECIPQQVELALSLPVVGNANETGEGSPLIAEAQAQVPVASPWEVTAQQSAIDPETAQGKLQLQVALSKDQQAQVQDIWFYPYDWGRIRQSDLQQRKNLTDVIQLEIPTGEAPAVIGDKLTGVLVIKEQQGIVRGYEINVPVQSLTSNQTAEGFAIGFASALLFALLGGVILNLMPCVFPVLSIKALSLVSHSNYSTVEIRRQGYVYTLGVLASFAVLALLLIVLKAGGNQIGWGFQFQSPIFVLLVAYLLFAVGLSLSGVFFIGGSVAGVGSSLTEKPGYSGSFFTGVLATVVATPCTAPFMAAALGYAVAQPPLKLLAIFLSLGLGLALPYLLLSCWPRLQRWLPRPGLWMERAKQLLAFPMYAAAIWLVWVLVQQAGVDAVIIALGGMLLIAIAAWLYDSTRTSTDGKRNLGNASVLALVLLAVGFGGVQVNLPANAAQKSAAADANWEAYSDERLQSLLAEGKPVFLNFTASWCISCLVNERVALSTDAVKKQFQQQGVVYLKGDWTNRDPQITAFLKKFNRSGVPLYVFYPAGQADSPKELPQILTPDLVVAAVSGQ